MVVVLNEYQNRINKNNKSYKKKHKVFMKC